MSERVAVLIGAGFSRWAAQLPVVSELFDFQVEPLNGREERWLNNIRQLKAAWDRTHSGAHPEHFIRDVLTSGRRRNSLYLLWYLTRRLSDPFVATIRGGRQTLMIDDKRRLGIPGVQSAKVFFSHLRGLPLGGIITPNYDLLIEYALGTSGFNYGEVGEVLTGRGKNPVFPWQGANPTLRGAVGLAKIHGSVSWADGIHYTDGRCGLRGRADIVPPVPGKQRPPELASAWTLAERILRAAEAILVFGFAFNPYDLAVLELLRGAVQVQAVLIIDPVPQLERAREVWPGSTISHCVPPTANRACIDAWLYTQRA